MFGGKAFDGEMLIAIDEKGVGTFYDTVKIKESNSSNNAPIGTARTNALSANSIAETGENVNTENENITEKFALPEKNSRNEALSEERRVFCPLPCR